MCPGGEPDCGCASLTGLNREQIVADEQLIRAEGIENLSWCPPYVFVALCEGFASPPYKHGCRLAPSGRHWDSLTVKGNLCETVGKTYGTRCGCWRRRPDFRR